MRRRGARSGHGSGSEMTKIVTIFLVVIALLAIFGRLRMPRLPGLGRVATTCPSCGRHKIGRGPCPCGASPPSNTRGG
ncbi:MAG: hypothetical protein RLZ26_2329 [Pseudomonadota bacterium]